MIRARSGELRLLTMAVVTGLLASCGQQSAPAKQAPIRTAKDDVDEVHALVSAIKQHPSMVDPKKNAGPPIHVDPYPHSGGPTPHPHVMK